MLSPEVIAANIPFGAVTSSSELKPVTASEKTNVTVDVSPVLSVVSLIINVSTVGANWSTVIVVPLTPPVVLLPAVSVSLALNVRATPSA